LAGGGKAPLGPNEAPPLALAMAEVPEQADRPGPVRAGQEGRPPRAPDS